MTSYGILLVILTLLLGGSIAVASTQYSKRQLHKEENFFTAGRNVSTALMIATFIAYAVGTGLLFSPAESAYTTGLTAMIGYALAISVAYVVFIPISKRIRELIPEGHTIGEYAKARYGPVMYAVTLLTTTIYMFILFASNLTGAALAFKYIGGIPMLISVLIVGVPTIYFATRGGVSAAIFSNGLQSILITPFLILPAVFALAHFGGPQPVYDAVMAAKPEFLKVFDRNGLEFAVMIIIAVCAAELLNQTLWQRVYSAKSHKVIKRSLLISAIMVFPMTIVAAFFGLAALSMNIEVPHTSVVAALVVDASVSRWVCTLFVLVIMLGASSTGGDALSGFSSIFSIDIVRTFAPQLDAKRSVRAAQIGAIVLGICGMVVAYFAPSILFLLLLADLLASAAVVPIIAGLYSPKISGVMAAVATITGILAGLPMFLAGKSLYSFLSALAASAVIILIAHFTGKRNFDYERLKTEITRL